MDSFFLKELVENLAFVTKAKHVLISRAAIKEASNFIDTAAFWSNDKFVENVRVVSPHLDI